MRLIPLVLLGLALASPAPAQAPAPSRAQLERLEAEQAEREKRLQRLSRDAAAARKEVERLRARLVEAAANRAKLEETAATSAARLRALRARERTMTAALTRDRKALEDILAALIAFERQRPPALAVNPNDAREAARAATLMGDVTPALEARARKIAADIAALKKTREEVLAQDTAFQKAAAALEAQRAEIDRLIEERLVLERSLLDDAAAERARIAAIAERAATLRELIARLTADPADGPGLPPSAAFPQRFADARGRLLWPTQGTVTQSFGVRAGAAGRSDGVTLQARPGAQVTAPFDGRVEYAGPFRSYGRLLIINVGSGYHVVLAGLGAVSAEAGQQVLAGEPVGEMDAGSGGSPELYVEVRRDGQPINPTPWFRAG